MDDYNRCWINFYDKWKKSLNLIICVYGRIDVFIINSINRLFSHFIYMYLYYKINENNVLLHECVTMLFEQLKLNKITGRAFAHVIKKFLYTILKQNISFFYSYSQLYYSKTRALKIYCSQMPALTLSSFDGVEFQMDPNYCGTR